jgi:hypothetical protein
VDAVSIGFTTHYVDLLDERGSAKSLQHMAHRTKVNPPGVVIAEGKSLFTGEQLIAVATGVRRPSTNKKTGPLIQVYVLSRDESPSSQAKSRRDKSICGNCKHRQSSLGTCYVDLSRGADRIWAAFHSSRYPEWTDAHATLFSNVVVRVTAYGDCAALPFNLWQPFVQLVRVNGGVVLGYTHSWRDCDPGFRDFCMASVDSKAEYAEANAMGYRTFRIRQKDSPLLPTEIQCPADTHADVSSLCGIAKGTVTCRECLACHGGLKGLNVSLVPHGINYRLQKLSHWITSRDT